MAVKMRLSRKGRKKAPFYHIVVADSRSPRDGRFIQKLGTYNPMTKPATIEIDRLAAYDWLTKGAQPTDTVKAILRFKGVYYRKHLMRGVQKGAFSLEQAEVLWQKWVDEKEVKIASRRAETMAEMEEFRKMISGEAKPRKVVADASAAEVFREDSGSAVEESTEVQSVEQVEESVEDNTPVEPAVAEAVEETVVEETAVEEAAVAEEPAVEEAVENTGSGEESVNETPAEETPAE